MESDASFNVSNASECLFQEQKRVKVHFPNDIEKLSALLDWFYNSGDVATIHMTDEVIEKGRKFTRIDIVEEKSA